MKSMCSASPGKSMSAMTIAWDARISQEIIGAMTGKENAALSLQMISLIQSLQTMGNIWNAAQVKQG